MKVAQLHQSHHLAVIEQPMRPPRPDELLVKVEGCGVCGTDLHIVEGTSRSQPPVVLGHEFFGIIEEKGNAVSELKSGERVAIDPNISCGTCFYCRRGLVHLCLNLKALGVDIDGGMAQYCTLPQQQAYLLPTTLSLEESVLVEPLSCVIHGTDKANIQFGDTVVVVGGGTVGLLMLQLVKSAGAVRVIVVEPVQFKRHIAESVGADLCINPRDQDAKAAILDLTGVGADVVIECVGTPQTVGLALQLVRRGGTVEFFGVCPLDATVSIRPHEVYFKELTIVGSYINPHTFARAIEMLKSKKVSIEPFRLKKFPLEGVHDALGELRDGKTIKSIILPHC